LDYLKGAVVGAELDTSPAVISYGKWWILALWSGEGGKKDVFFF
jgi:hypothetical protein